MIADRDYISNNVIMAKPTSERIVNWSLLRLRIGKFLRLLVWPIAVTVSAWLILTNIQQITSTNVNHDIILSYVNALIWPLFAFVVLFVVRPHLPGLMSRIEEAGFAGAKVKFERQKVQQESSSDNSPLRNTEDADEPVDEEDENAQTIAALQTDAAEKAYEQIYRQIFGTQLDVLKRLRLYENGLKEDDLSDIFNLHKHLAAKLNPNNNPTFMNFIQFLKFNTLVNYNPETGVYYLTWAGLYFLIYLEKQGIINDFKSL